MVISSLILSLSGSVRQKAEPMAEKKKRYKRADKLWIDYIKSCLSSVSSGIMNEEREMHDTERPRVAVQVKRLMEEAILPEYAHSDDACADIYTLSTASLSPGEMLPFYTGLSFAIPDGWRIDIRPRSGMACKHQLLIPNSPGTIDAGYRGELIVYLKNIGHDLIKIKEGDRIAQMKIEPVWQIEFEEVDTLPESGRGGGGFGSTGR